MKIGVLGGTFDPVHIGHLIIAQEALLKLQLQKILFMPLNQSEKKIPVACPHHRVRMLELAIGDNSRFAIDLREIERGGITYSIDSILELKKELPDSDIFFIVGSDALSSLPTWKNAEKLIKLVKFALYNRKGFDSFNNLCKPVIINGPDIDISSSAIRQRIRRGWPIRYMVPGEVVKYIKENKIY